MSTRRAALALTSLALVSILGCADPIATPTPAPDESHEFSNDWGRRDQDLITWGEIKIILGDGHGSASDSTKNDG